MTRIIKILRVRTKLTQILQLMTPLIKIQQLLKKPIPLPASLLNTILKKLTPANSAISLKQVAT